MLGINSHTTCLGSAVFDRVRLVKGVIHELDLHASRVNASAKERGLKPTLSGKEIDVSILPPGTENPDFALYRKELPTAKSGGLPQPVTKFCRLTMEVNSIIDDSHKTEEFFEWQHLKGLARNRLADRDIPTRPITYKGRRALLELGT